jgi:DNA replication protein DnaC
LSVIRVAGRPQRRGRLDTELDRLQRVALLVCDEVGYIPFDPQAANLMFMLVSRRYERASLIVTSNKPFSTWGEIFGDEVTATAIIDRLVHHAEILSRWAFDLVSTPARQSSFVPLLPGFRSSATVVRTRSSRHASRR